MKAAPLYSEVCRVSSYRRKSIFGAFGGGGIPGWFGLYADRLDVKVFFLPFASIRAVDIENVEVRKSFLGARAKIFSKESDIVVSVSISDVKALDAQLKLMHVKVTGDVQVHSKTN